MPATISTSSDACSTFSLNTNVITTGNAFLNGICIPQRNHDTTQNNLRTPPISNSSNMTSSIAPCEIYCQNVNGLLTKRNLLLAEVLAADYSIYAFTETALNDSIASNELFPSNFSVYRCDRSEKTSKKTSKGGVLVAVNKSLDSQLIESCEDNGCEQVWVKVTNGVTNLIVASIYIPPSQPISVYEAHLSCIRRIANTMDNDTKVLIYGDFNLPDLKWQMDDDSASFIPINISKPIEREVLDTCHEMSLLQINNVHNQNGRLLDLAWTNFPDKFNVNISRMNLLHDEVHHKAIVIEYFIESSNVDDYSHDDDLYFDFGNANYATLNDKISMIDWKEQLKYGSLDDKTQRFYDLLNGVITSTVKIKKRKCSIHPKWFDRAAINLKNQVNKCHKLRRYHKTTDFIDKFKSKQREYKSHVRQCYYNYKMEMQQLIWDDPQQFHKHVKYSSKQSNDMPSCMSYGDRLAKTPDEIADLFRLFFESVYQEPVDGATLRFDMACKTKNKIKDTCTNISSLSIDEDAVIKSIESLPNNLVAGPDNIPNMLLRQCVHSIAKPIAQLLSESLCNGFTPMLWKSSFIYPIFKSGGKNSIENYRGVAIQCSIPKLLDSMIAKHINFHLRNVIPSNQHGFVGGRSTITNLAEYISNVMNGMCNAKQVDAIYLDIKKAFDSVDVVLLCHKLEIMGLNTILLNWIRDYLSNRRQMVKLSTSCISQHIRVTSGVGQGYPIGATLFILFIMDLPFQVENAWLHLFADDAKLSMPINTTHDCQVLQDDVDRVSQYFDYHCLQLNVKKSNSITFYRNKSTIQYVYTIKGLVVEKVQHIKDLGVILDQNLSFANHIEYITTKSKSRLAWVRRFSREFDDPWVIKQLYMTFVAPILEYASQIWSPLQLYQIKKIESIQKQFLLFALRKFKWKNRFQLPSYKNRLLLLRMNTLEERREIAQVAFIQSILNGAISSPFLLSKINWIVPQRLTRNSKLFKTTFLNDPMNIMIKNYNVFADKFEFNQKAESVRQSLKKYYLQMI